MSSGSERERTQKLREAAAKLDENILPLKQWSRRIKIAVVALMLLSTAFMNGLITGETHEGVVVDRSFNTEFVSWSNLMLTLKESWFMIVALVAYLLMAEYNRRLDEEEMHFVEAQLKEEKQFDVDDSDTTSHGSGSGSSSHEHSADEGKRKAPKATPTDQLAASLGSINTQIQTQPDTQYDTTSRVSELNSTTRHMISESSETSSPLKKKVFKEQSQADQPIYKTQNKE